MKRTSPVQFFFKEAGWSYHPKKETPREGRMRGARELAAAEKLASEKGWSVEWEHDQEPYEMGDAETEMPGEVLCAILRDEEGKPLGSLCQIGDPSRGYRRVVEAELASQAVDDDELKKAIRQLTPKKATKRKK